MTGHGRATGPSPGDATVGGRIEPAPLLELAAPPADRARTMTVVGDQTARPDHHTVMRRGRATATRIGRAGPPTGPVGRRADLVVRLGPAARRAPAPAHAGGAVGEPSHAEASRTANGDRD